MQIRKILKNSIVKNSAWIMAGKIVHMLLSFAVGLLTARYLGPSNYGILGYAAAYTTFFTVFCTLGINSIIVKEMIDHPKEQGAFLGTTIVLRLVSSFLSLGLIAMIARAVNRDDKLTIAVVTLFSVSLVFQSFDSFRQWFQCRLMSKYYAIATTVSYVAASAYRIYLLETGKDVIWFAVANTVDYLTVAVILYSFYKKNKGPKLAFSWTKVRHLLSLSFGYILSGLMVEILASTDRFMLKHMLDTTTVGYYTLSVSISAMWVFVISAIIESMFPSIMENHNSQKALYLRANRRLYAIVFYVSIFASAIICLIGPVFIRIVYGETYLPAVSSLRVIVWYVAFSYLGVARDAWIVCERKQKYLKYIYLCAAIVNIVINALLIPIWGAVGAAVASLLTQFSTVFVFPLLFRELRPNVRLMMEGILLRGVFDRKKEGDDYS